MEENQFDTIYHEHFSYFSLVTVENVFAAHGLTLFDVEELDTHRIAADLRSPRRRYHTGGVLAPRRASGSRDRGRFRHHGALRELHAPGHGDQARHPSVPDRSEGSRQEDRRLRRAWQRQHVAQLLRHPHRFLDFTVDRNPYKQGKYTPGTHIPILAPEAIREAQPDQSLLRCHVLVPIQISGGICLS